MLPINKTTPNDKKFTGRCSKEFCWWQSTLDHGNLTGNVSLVNRKYNTSNTMYNVLFCLKNCVTSWLEIQSECVCGELTLVKVTGYFGIKTLRYQAFLVLVPKCPETPRRWCRTGPDTSDPVPKCLETLRYRCRSVPRHFGTVCFEARSCSRSEHLKTWRLVDNKIQLKYLTQVLFAYTKAIARHLGWARC